MSFPTSFPVRRSSRIFRLRMSTGRSALLLVALLAFVSGPAGAQQTLSGRVIDAESGEPVVGGLLTAIDRDGRAGAGAITDEAGRFTLDLRTGFELQRVRVERIGYATRFFDAADLSARSGIVLRVSSEPVTLEGIAAVTESLCGDDVRGTGPVQDLWEEAGKSLRITEVSQRDRILRFETRRIARRLTPGDHAVLERDVRRRRHFAEKPYRSISVEEMTDRGWIEETGDGELIYYAPDASILLSEAFTDQHCFGAERTDDAILLHFEPNRRRSHVPEIEGVLSLDPRTKELTELRFHYVSALLPPGSGEEAGGEVHYYGAPNGLRVVREWAIRMPVVDVIRTGFRGEYSENVRLRHVREEGGRVASIRVGDSDMELPPLHGPGALARYGLTKESEDLGGQQGVALYLRNDLRAPVRVTSLELWDCENVRTHCSRRDLDIVVRPGERKLLLVVPQDDIREPMEFQWTYTAVNVGEGEEDRAAMAEGGGGPAPGTSSPTLEGRVLDGGSGNPVAMAYVALESEGGRLVDAGTTNDRGLFVLDAPSPGSYHLRVSSVGYRPVADSVFELGEAGSTPVQIRLEPAPVMLDPIEAVVERTEGYLREIGFYERREQGWGSYLTHEEVREKATVSVVDAILDIPRVHVAEDPADPDSPYPSVVMRYGRYRCPPHIYVDGSLVYRGGVRRRTPEPDRGPAMPDEFAHPDGISAMEVYRGSTEVPPRYRLPNTCGVILIWTWR